MYTRILRAYNASKCKEEENKRLAYTRRKHIRYAYAFTQLTLRAFRGKKALTFLRLRATR